MNKAYYCGRRPKSDAFDDTPDPTYLGEEDDLIKEKKNRKKKKLTKKSILTSRPLAVTPFGLTTARIWISTSDMVG